MRVGKDILVTGFDDSEVATSLKPMLTTVRTNISSMGYQSVREMVRLLQTGHAESKTLDARLIVRESCDLTTEQIQEMAENCAAEEIVNMIFNKYIGDLETVAKTKFIEDVWTLVREEFQTICSRQILDIPWFRQQLAQLFDRTDVIPVQVPLLKKIVTYARDLATQICQHGSTLRAVISTCSTSRWYTISMKSGSCRRISI